MIDGRPYKMDKITYEDFLMVNNENIITGKLHLYTEENFPLSKCNYIHVTDGNEVIRLSDVTISSREKIDNDDITVIKIKVKSATRRKRKQ
jgi:hypothetical protein